MPAVPPPPSTPAIPILFEDERPTQPASPAAKRLRAPVRCPACGGPDSTRIVQCLLCASQGFVTLDEAQTFQAQRESVMREVPAERTIVSRFQMIDAMRDAWTKLAGAPADHSLAILLGHWALETGTGKSMMNFNVGNWKAPRPLDQEHTYFTTRENLSPKGADAAVAASTPAAPCHILGPASNGTLVVIFEPRHPTCRFRSFPTLEVGCEAYVTGMRGAWAAAWDAAVRGDVVGFADALAKARYFTAPVGEYVAGVSAHARIFTSLLVALPDPMAFEAWSSADVQRVLCKLGFDAGPADGVPGNLTKGALCSFQTHEGLSATGLIDLDTRARLGNRLGEVLSSSNA